MSRKLIHVIAASVPLLCASVSHAIIGAGIHWGNDLTLVMDDKIGEQLAFEKFQINISSIAGTPPSELTTVSGKDLPLYVDRSDWQRTMFNLGGKVFIDIIPVLDAIELSANYGLWEYDGQVRYPSTLRFKNNVTAAAIGHPEQLFEVGYTTLPVTLKEFDMEFLGLSKTPYMKLNFDLTVRKYILRIPPVLHTLRIHAGAGTSLHFATPILSKGLIEDALGTALIGSKNVSSLSTDLFDSNNEISEKIIREIMDNMMTPHWGCHLDLGVMLKIPVMPLGFYIDGKFMIPFGDMDKAADLGGFGLLINSGICLTL
jgi:hypothetical protein